MTIFRLWLDRALRALCIALFALLVLLVVWQVFTRLVLHSPSAWSEEAARYAFVWLSLIGISVAVGEKADVVMDFVVEKLPRAIQRYVDLLAYFAVLAFVVYVMLYGGYMQSAMSWTQTNPLLPFTQGQLSLALPVSGVLLTFYVILHIVGTLSKSYPGHRVVDDELEAVTQELGLPANG
ncbi:TRAP-type C4-dicarboxylate transport system permease small subunit [Leucobacter exalbidus]|uniref:TRAP-type C4-dicarboxylate transport system permease small subunit n=1 Tax=Leucobacter exalbidus TaxID=662960 RepID=A0A940PTV0_9MICO|nr:TRAP transporter small permease [Leucobacter exalbidus]MBP1326802.1 TRAP-type C4-dicarboxylate transport system permease small subunit [Leucobacter exalbidus]